MNRAELKAWKKKLEERLDTVIVAASKDERTTQEQKKLMTEASSFLAVAVLGRDSIEGDEDFTIALNALSQANAVLHELEFAFGSRA